MNDQNIYENFIQKPIYQEFLVYLKKKYLDEYDSFTSEDFEDKFETVFTVGMLQMKKFLKTNRSHYLLYNGRPARQDMVVRLGNILYELHKENNYPIVLPLRLRDAIKKVIGSDKRYIKKYLDWILNISNYQSTFNRVDMSILVSVFPDELILGKEIVF